MLEIREQGNKYTISMIDDTRSRTIMCASKLAARLAIRRFMMKYFGRNTSRGENELIRNNR